MRKHIFAGIGVIIVVIVCAVFIRWHTSRPSTPVQGSGDSNFDILTAGKPVSPYPDAPAKKPPRTPPSGYDEYRNEFYWFQLLYPASLHESTYKQANSASTFVFENAADTQGFQVFIVPYAATSVSAEVFALDEPSGVMASSSQVSIDGTPGESFYGKDATIGPTFEMWFINDGFLYEVVASASQDAWLKQIMQSWQFL